MAQRTVAPSRGGDATLTTKSSDAENSCLPVTYTYTGLRPAPRSPHSVSAIRARNVAWERRAPWRDFFDKAEKRASHVTYTLRGGGSAAETPTMSESRTGAIRMTPEPPIPVRRYLSRDEAAAWLGVSVDTFARFTIPYCDFGPRSRRWDVFDIIAYADQNKRCDSARASDADAERSGQRCDSTDDPARLIGGSHGTTRTESAIAEVLGLTTAGSRKRLRESG